MATRKSNTTTISLASGWIFFQAGPHQMLKVTDVSVDTEQVVLIQVCDRRGATGRIRFDLGSKNETVDNLFATLVKLCLHDWSLESVNLPDLIGCYFYADVSFYQAEDGRSFPRFSNYAEAPFDKNGERVIKAAETGTF